MNQILVVEDNLQIPESLVDLLKKGGYRSSFCHLGEHVAKPIYQTRPSLILLDLKNPSTKGFEACVDIRKVCDLPIIMMSENAGYRERIQAFSLGIDDFINKPFSHPELLLRIRCVLKRTTRYSSINQKQH